MEVKQLRSFVAVARALNFGRAARTLHLSQPALSAQIKALEEDLGAELFVRNRRRVALTGVGQTLLVDAEQLLQHISEIELRIKRVSSGQTGLLRIGFVMSAALDLIPAITLAFKKQFTSVEFELKNLSTVQQVEALRSGALDVGFLRLPLQESGFSIMRVAQEPFAVALPKHHPLARRRSVSVRDLAQEPFVAYGERWAPAFYQRWTSLCRAADFTPRIVQETGEMETAIALVAAGLGVAILPAGITRRHGGIIAVKVLTQERTRSEIGLAFVSARQTPLLRQFVSIAEQVVVTAGSRAPLLI